ncbi:hypothetical protein DXG01_013039, partial [Tephrocybe rancida]
YEDEFLSRQTSLMLRLGRYVHAVNQASPLFIWHTTSKLVDWAYKGNLQPAHIVKLSIMRNKALIIGLILMTAWFEALASSLAHRSESGNKSFEEANTKLAPFGVWKVVKETCQAYGVRLYSARLYDSQS